MTPVGPLYFNSFLSYSQITMLFDECFLQNRVKYFLCNPVNKPKNQQMGTGENTQVVFGVHFYQHLPTFINNSALVHYC